MPFAKVFSGGDDVSISRSAGEGADVGAAAEVPLVSRSGCSASEPNIDDIDMLLPGRCVVLDIDTRLLALENGRGGAKPREVGIWTLCCTGGRCGDGGSIVRVLNGGGGGGGWSGFPTDVTKSQSILQSLDMTNNRHLIQASHFTTHFTLLEKCEEIWR